MLVAVNKELKHTAKTEWHTTGKHGMGQSDLSPISRIPGALGIINQRARSASWLYSLHIQQGRME